MFVLCNKLDIYTYLLQYATFELLVFNNEMLKSLFEQYFVIRWEIHCK
jgi:hypothetical protein